MIFSTIGTARIVRADPGTENVKWKSYKNFSRSTDVIALQGTGVFCLKVHNISGNSNAQIP